MLLRQFKKNNSTLLGLDITPTTIQVLELRQTAQSYQVEAYACTSNEKLNNQATAMHQQDAAYLYPTLQQLLRQSGTRLRVAAIALADHTIISKIMPFDVSCTSDEIEQHISEDLKKSFAQNKQAIQYDYQIIGASPQYPDCNNILLAATEPQHIKSRVAALQKSGLTIKVVDIESLAIARACTLIPQILSYLQNQHLVAVAHLHPTHCTFMVLQNTAPLFTRTFTVSQANANSSGETNTNKTQEEIILQVINQALQAFNTTYTSHTLPPIHHLLLSGEIENLVALASLITAKFKLGCSVANPFSHLSFADRCDKQLLLQQAPQFMVCCGLAMRKYN